MGARFRSWWQQIKIHPVATTLIALFVALSVLVIFGGYKFNWDWTGFNSPSKTLWDWLQLLGVLAVPVAVGFGAVWFTTRQSKVSDAENKDNQRETALQAYIDKISELLLKEHLDERTADGKLIQPSSTEPSSVEPSSAKPISTKPTSAKPISTKPTSAKPSSTKPTSAKQTLAEPNSWRPISKALTLAEPTLAEPT